jgi:hypothetical protein
MLKKLIVATAAVALSAPALADNGYHYGHRHAYRHAHTYVVQRPVVYHVYRPAPRPVYVVPRPAPVVQYHYDYTYARPDPVPAIFLGAVLGAAIAHHVVTGY